MNSVEARSIVYYLLKYKFEYEPNEYEKLDFGIRTEVEQLCSVRKCKDCGRTFVYPYVSVADFKEMEKDFTTIIRCEDCSKKYETDNHNKYIEEKNRKYFCIDCGNVQEQSGSCHKCIHAFGKYNVVKLMA